MNKWQKLVYALLCTSMLASCWQKGVETSQVSHQASSQEWISESTGSSWDTISEETWVQKELKISSRCIGCGHCVKFAVDNFKMNFSNHKAEVISQSNINSSGVERAIDRCPVDAISIS